jgi:multiple sugar transport system substrate-binding protein
MVPEWEQIAMRLQEQTERAVRGGASPDSVLSEYDRDVDRMLEKRRWMESRRLRTRRAATRGEG